MRNSRRLTWLIFAVCALLVVDGLGWVTWQMLSLEGREHEAQHRAERQEAVRLALWRMDALLSPVIAAEAARPYFHYRSFYPAERAYTRMWEPIGPKEVLVPSPLLAGPGEYIRLHFEGSADGWITSPQVPDEELRDRAHDVTPADIQRAERELLQLTALLRGTPETAEDMRGADASALAAPRGDGLLAERNVQLQEIARADLDQPAAQQMQLPESERDADDEAGRSATEYQARRQAADFARNTQSPSERLRLGTGAEGLRIDSAEIADREAAPAEPFDEVHTGPLTPYWLRSPGAQEPELLLIRVVRVNGSETLQGIWMDWPALRDALLATGRDLLPEAALQPVLTESGARPAASVSLADAGRLLAGVPAALIPGPMADVAIRGLTPTRTVLVIAWLAVVAAIVAIAAVLRASLALSERRGRFVSAVTHELRTPLTTFCLYSQMLADGMVRDERRRGEYLGTLKRESERLAGIVENVLVYARMGSRERRGSGAGGASLAVAELLATLGPSLRERADQAGMRLEIDDTGVGEARVAADRESVERVIVNLVDNACKYAAEAEDKRISLTVRPAAGGAEFRVRDRGPGVPKRERRRIFSPFTRARRHAADGSSGLGLGLALARGVARSLGGELRLARSEPGAEFVLWLPGAICPPEAG